MRDIPNGDVVQGVARLLGGVSLGRQATCRLWKGTNQTLYKLPAPTFSAFDAKVRTKFGPSEAEIISYYYITHRKDISSRVYNANDEDLNDYFEVAGNPTIYIRLPGASQSSPESLPAEIQTKVASDEASELTSDVGSTRGNQQASFRKALRERDNNACVLSRTLLVDKAGNVEAAHIFGVEGALKDKRRDADVLNSYYDTVNGMLLEKSLHVAFDSYQWCMDANGVVSVADYAIPCTLAKWKGAQLKLDIGELNFPTKSILQARYDLFSSKCVLRKNARKKKRRKTTAFTV